MAQLVSTEVQCIVHTQVQVHTQDSRKSFYKHVGQIISRALPSIGKYGLQKHHLLQLQ